MNNKADLTDVTFLIAVKLDSIDRLENIIMVIDFLSFHFKTNIQILEASNYNSRILEQLLKPNADVTFVEDYDPVFHRTKYINQLIKQCQSPLLAIWDADIIIDPIQILKAVELLRSKEASFCFPYKDKFLDTSLILREIFLKTKNIKILRENEGKMKLLYQPDPIGGAFFAITDDYIASGMENENFYGWGREDGERLIRWEILGYQYKRINGPLYHLSHQRGINSTFHSKNQDDIKWMEIQRIKSMSKKELIKTINSWQ